MGDMRVPCHLLFAAIVAQCSQEALEESGKEESQQLGEQLLTAADLWPEPKITEPAQ